MSRWITLLLIVAGLPSAMPHDACAGYKVSSRLTPVLEHAGYYTLHITLYEVHVVDGETTVKQLSETKPIVMQSNQPGKVSVSDEMDGWTVQAMVKEDEMAVSCSVEIRENGDIAYASDFEVVLPKHLGQQNPGRDVETTHAQQD